MTWYNNIFRSVEDVWIVWLVSCVLLYVLTRVLFSRVRRCNASRFLREERGASYSLGLVLVVPFYTLLIATVVETTLMLVVKTGTTYAAYAATRAAIVWLPDERIPSTDAPDYIPPARRQGMVHLAAVNAMWPYASGSDEHTAGGPGAFGYDPQAAQACIKGYRRYCDGKAPEDYLDRKWRYAAKATQIKMERSSDAFNADLTVTVEYEMPLNIPGVGRFLGGRASWGGAKYFTRKISSNVTLEKEGPKSDSQSLGITYYVDHSKYSTTAPCCNDAEDNPGDGKPNAQGHYSCEDVRKILQDIADDTLLGSLRDHFGQGKYDFKMKEPNATFDVFGKTMNAAEFGNFIAGFAGQVNGWQFGADGVRIGGVLYDAADSFVYWMAKQLGVDPRLPKGLDPPTFDFDYDSWPDIEAGVKLPEKYEQYGYVPSCR